MLEPTEMKNVFLICSHGGSTNAQGVCVGADDCSSPRSCPRAAGRGSVSPTSPTAVQKHPARGDLKLAAELAQRLLMLTDWATNPEASSLRGSSVQLGNAVSRCSSVANKRHVQSTRGGRIGDRKRSISSCWANLRSSEVVAPVTWPQNRDAQLTPSQTYGLYRNASGLRVLVIKK